MFRTSAMSAALVWLAGTAFAQTQPVIVDEAVQLPAAEGFAFNGRSIDIEGDTMAVAGVGGFHVYERAGEDWAEVASGSVSGLAGYGGTGGIDISGDRIVVAGDPCRVLLRDVNGWSDEASLFPNVPDARLIRSVTIDGDTVAIGVTTMDFPGGTFGPIVGRVVIFRRSGTVWSEEAQLVSGHAGLRSRFGVSCDLQGDRLLIGDYANSGFAQIWERTGTNWALTGRLFEPGPGVGDRFGWAVAFDGDVAVCGAPRRRRGDDWVGAVFVFRHQSAGDEWLFEAELRASDGDHQDRFGAAVDVEGDRIVVGTMTDSISNLVADPGSVYLFERLNGEWVQQAKTWSDAPNNTGRFGAAVALDGDVIAVHERRGGVAHVKRVETGSHASFCFGNGEGCSPCPCGNEAAPSSRGGCLNRRGKSCTLFVTGSASVSFDSLRFGLHGGHSWTPHELESGDNQLPNLGPCPPGSGNVSPVMNGLRCVGGNLFRHGFITPQNSGDAHVPSSGWGPGVIAQAGFTAGQTRHFQVFYREDPSSGCGNPQNTSNAVSVTFEP